MAAVYGARWSSNVRGPRVAAVSVHHGAQHVTLAEAHGGLRHYILPRGVELEVGEVVPIAWLYRRADGAKPVATRAQQHERAAFAAGVSPGRLSGLSGGGMAAESRIEQAKALFVKDGIDVVEFERIVGAALGVR
jgi:hypothetical protein